jgi:hypothetical protein
MAGLMEEALLIGSLDVGKIEFKLAKSSNCARPMVSIGSPQVAGCVFAE